jgi:hypothetical protein
MYKGLLFVGFAASLAACSGESARGDGSLSVTEEALSDSCGNAGTDAVYTGFIDPEIVSPQTYNRCTKSYVAQVNTLSSAYVGPGSGGGPNGRFVVRFADTFTNTQAGCEDLEGAAIIFKKNGTSWVNISGGQIYTNGMWSSFLGCQTPFITFDNLEAGQSYKIAATMRVMSGTNPTRKVAISTEKPVDIN